MTSKVAHTPGPWSRRSIPGHLFEINSDEGPVLRIRSGMNPTLADARLIEAAPDMLEALEQISTDIAQSILEQPMETQDGRFFVGLNSRAKMQAAIKKARGQQ